MGADLGYWNQGDRAAFPDLTVSSAPPREKGNMQLARVHYAFFSLFQCKSHMGSYNPPFTGEQHRESVEADMNSGLIQNS